MKRQAVHMDKQIVKTVRLDYQLYVPAGYEQDESASWPLILYLHGAGGSGPDRDQLRKEGLPQRVESGSGLPFFVAAPHCPLGSFWNTMEDELLAMLDDLSRAWRIDDSRLYLTGFSMGAYGVWNLADRHPQRFAAVAPVSGGGDPAHSKRLSDMPAWIFHGEADEVIRSSESLKMAEAMREAGAEVELTLYPGVGHDCWKNVYANEGLYRWFLEHSRTGGRRNDKEDDMKESKLEWREHSGSAQSEVRSANSVNDVSGSTGAAANPLSANAAPKLPELIFLPDGTERLKIVPIEEADIDEMLELELRNKEFFSRFSPVRDDSFYTREAQEKRIRTMAEAARHDERYQFTVRERESGRLVGVTDLTGIQRGSLQGAWIGYFMDRSCNGKGYMTEAVRYTVRYAFEVLALHRIEAGVMPHNEPSLRVLAKAGFEREGISRKNVKINGRWRDHVLLAILNPKDDEE
ncbi:GNAT family N-acetyltransferase [Saccharibacillus sp. CPCC 101409]|uniref:GNAT family N-acetyltransferase n=1 Tax=Saccharibacillus sp. CPCC 101409 TaxID=3058041 RepID=UPI0026735FC0|nr:GNAT family N-acetyltransferase [Saccharibacillus sp. CPCC 101409]MDO3412191.1 GNAT family N-acetyltransferase [Saccharibacillus sp. CPCC 101409]